MGLGQVADASLSSEISVENDDDDDDVARACFGEQRTVKKVFCGLARAADGREKFAREREERGERERENTAAQASAKINALLRLRLPV